MDSLAAKRCIPCEGGMPKFTREEAEKYLMMVDGWELKDDATEISKKFKFKDFKAALAFVNEVGRIAETEGHHPDLSFGWGKAKVRLSTHEIGGLAENDFIVAAKIDTIPLD